MRSIIVIAILLCVVTANRRNTDPLVRAVEDGIDVVRQAVTPPCDYRSTGGVASPCNGQNRNKLPFVRWSAELATVSSDYASMCPTTSNPMLRAGLGQLILVSYHTEQLTDAQLLGRALALWSTSIGYNATTGEAIGSRARAYKQLVLSTNRRVGCAVQRQCPRGLRAVCTFDSAPTTAPAYPALIINATMREAFQTSILRWLNHARTLTRPNPSIPLMPLGWDAHLAAGAQAQADRQGSVPEGTYDSSFTLGEVKFSTRSVWVNPAFVSVLNWFARGRWYRYGDNTCRSVDSYNGVSTPRRCGEYTQIMGQQAHMVGCGFANRNGRVYVYCRFNRSYNKDGSHTERPWAI